MTKKEIKIAIKIFKNEIKEYQKAIKLAEKELLKIEKK